MMGQSSVADDLPATMFVVCMFAIFVVTLAHSYHVHAERGNIRESFGLALKACEELKDRVLISSPGAIEWVPGKLDEQSKLLAQLGVKIRVEIRDLEGRILHAHGPKPNRLEVFFSPPCTVSLPVALVRSRGSAELCELIVKVWR